MILGISCSVGREKNEKLIVSNSFLTGTWKGEGQFFDTSLNSNIGPVPFEIVITNSGIAGKAGDASLTKTSIAKTGYGFEIRGILDTKLKKDQDL